MSKEKDANIQLAVTDYSNVVDELKKNDEEQSKLIEDLILENEKLKNNINLLENITKIELFKLKYPKGRIEQTSVFTHKHNNSIEENVGLTYIDKSYSNSYELYHSTDKLEFKYKIKSNIRKNTTITVKGYSDKSIFPKVIQKYKLQGNILIGYIKFGLFSKKITNNIVGVKTNKRILFL